MWMNIIGCIWQLWNNVKLPRSPANFTVGFVDNMLCSARCKLRLINHYPVEESVTFKMASSQGSLPVIRDVHYGLWSHPVNICICVCALLCKLKVSLGVESYLALEHESAFPFSVPYSSACLVSIFNSLISSLWCGYKHAAGRVEIEIWALYLGVYVHVFCTLALI